MLEKAIGGDAGQQMCLTLAHRRERGVGQEVTVPQQQHIRLQKPQQVRCHADLSVLEGFEQKTPQHMAASLAQRQQPYLRKSPGRPPTARAAEGTLIGWGIGHIQHETIQGHQTHSAVKCSGCLGLAEQPNHLLG